MKIDRLDSATLAPYLPIKNAARNLIWLFLFASVAVTGFGLAVMNVTPQDTTMPPLAGTGLGYALIGALCSVGMVFVILWSHPECDGNMFKWTRHFVDRNVYGHRLWCCVDDSGTVSYELVPIKDELLWKFSKEPLFAIGFPTNGSDPCLARYAGGTFNVPRNCARMVGLFPEKNVLNLRITDYDGNVLTLEIRDLLSLIHKECLDPGRFIAGLSTHFDLVMRLIDRDRILDLTREILLSERLERDKAVGDIEEAIAQIDATKRFVRSKEGGAVRSWLADKLGSHLTFRDIPRKQRDAA